MTRTFRQRVLDRAVYIAVRVLICVIQAIPRQTSERLAKHLSVILAHRLRIRRKVVRQNLANAFPDWTTDQIREAARGMWEHLLLMVVEIAHANRVLRMTTWRRHLRIAGIDQVVRTMWSDRPKVVLSGHYGNFELAAYLFGVFGFRTFSVARELDNPLLDRFVTEFRESRGQRILPKRGSAPDVSLVLEEKGALGLLGDQAAGPRSSWVNFFGRPVSVHKAIAVFALTSEAPVMVFTATRRGSLFSFDVRLEGLVDPADDGPHTVDNQALSQWYTSLLETAIRRVPAQYWWVHNRWRGAPPKVTKRQQAA
jgi:KDO2-lipid IV(A) lauroyltransferase